MLRLSPFITVYCCAVAALLGACTGSFLACLAWRTVHGESVLRGRSHCDVCGHVLGVRDLVPVFSYLLSGGKCRYCGAKLSARHVWGELISAAVFVSLLLQYDISLQTLEGWLLACVLLACAFADLEGYIIPDRFIAAGVVLFAVTLLIEPEPFRRLADGLLGGVGVGGGLLRDIMARDMPYIFIKHIYACASLAGALLCGLMRPVGEMPAMVAGAALVFVIRCLSAHYRWNLPKTCD